MKRIEPWPVCGRLLVGQGDDTYDPICLRVDGHPGACNPTKPHLYVFCGWWWFSRNGLASHRRGITLNDYTVTQHV